MMATPTEAIYENQKISYYKPSKISNNEKNSMKRYHEEILGNSIPTKVKDLSLINRIIKIKKLQLNWDGYDAIPVNELAIHHFASFIELVELNSKLKLEEDNIYPTTYGTLIFDIYNQIGEKISIEFGKTQFSFYTKFNDLVNFELEGAKFNASYLPKEFESAIIKLSKISTLQEN